MSIISSNSERVIVYRSKLIFVVYEINLGLPIKLYSIDVVKELRACGYPDFEFTQNDKVTDMRFLNQ